MIFAPARNLALSLKMSARHFLHAQSWKKGIIYLVVDASRYENPENLLLGQVIDFEYGFYKIAANNVAYYISPKNLKEPDFDFSDKRDYVFELRNVKESIAEREEGRNDRGDGKSRRSVPRFEE